MKILRLSSFLSLMIACALAVAPAMAQAPAKAKVADKAAPKAGALLDINSAPMSELKDLPGIGDALSKKIVDGRPYSGKDDLVNKKIIPQATYDKIKDRIIAKQQGAVKGKTK